MKNILSVFILLLCVSIIKSCSNKSTAPRDQEELNQPSIGDDIPSDVASSIFDKAPITTKDASKLEGLEKDCHGKRRVSQTLEEVNATILKVADRYVISTNGGNSRYLPCDLPSKIKKDGILVRFSGDVLEVFPNERLIATPFRVKNIVERDN